MLKTNIKEIIVESQADVSVFIKKINGEEIISIGSKDIFPSGSLIKLVIMCEVLNQKNENRLNLDKKIKITDKVRVGGSGIIQGLEIGHEFSLGELMTLMIILSDNIATNILIDILGMENINETAKKLGLRNTILERKMMDFAALALGRENYTCAEDMVKLLEEIYLGNKIEKTSSEIMVDTLKKQQIGGRIGLYLPKDIIIANKTGSWDYIEHDVGIVYFPWGEYIIAVLTKELKSNEQGKKIIGKIARLLYDSLEMQDKENLCKEFH